MSRNRLKSALRAAKLTPTLFAKLTGLSGTLMARLTAGYEPVPRWIVAVAEITASAPRKSVQSAFLRLADEPEWKAMARFPGYEVSNFGQIRRAVPTGRTHYTGVMRLHVGPDGYLCVHLIREGKQTRAYVHRMVAEAFCSRKAGRSIACHRDGDRHNNSAANLYWGTDRDNARDRDRHRYERWLKARGRRAKSVHRES